MEEVAKKVEMLSSPYDQLVAGIVPQEPQEGGDHAVAAGPWHRIYSRWKIRPRSFNG